MVLKVTNVLCTVVLAVLVFFPQLVVLKQAGEWSIATKDSLRHAARDSSRAGCTGRTESLFDGGDPAIGWRAVSADRFPYEGWAVEDSVLMVLPGQPGADIMTREQFSDFELELEFKLSDSANTGIKYFVSPLRNKKGKMVLNGPEYQLIDDFKHESVKGNKNPETSTGSLYLLYEPGEKMLHKAGEWNHAKIVAKGRHVEHWLNGRQVLQYERGSKSFRARVAKTKFNAYETETRYGEAASGHILLQGHGDRVFFKNIRIKREIK